MGIARNASIFGLKVLNDDGIGNMTTIVAGLNKVLDARIADPDRPMVVSMSLGAYCGDYCSTDVMIEAVEILSDNNITVVVAAGNDGLDTCLYTPAAAPSAITVSATGPNDAFESYPGNGSCVNILAPGISVTGACASSSLDGCENGDSYVEVTDFYMASPHVSGVASLWLGRSLNHTVHPQAVMNALNCDGAKGVISGVATGAPNLLLQVPSASMGQSAEDISCVTAGCNVTNVESGEVCSGHGKCFFGACSCDGDYSGESCEYYFPEWLDDSFCCDGDALSNSNVAPYNTLAFLWTDLNPWAGGEIFYGYISDLDSFAVVFNDIPSYSSLSCRTTIEVLLRSSGDISLVYIDNAIGVEDYCYLRAVSVGLKGREGSDFAFLQLYGPSLTGLPASATVQISNLQSPTSSPALVPTFHPSVRSSPVPSQHPTSPHPTVYPSAMNGRYNVYEKTFSGSYVQQHNSSTSLSSLSLSDDQVSHLNLPFKFNFYGDEFEHAFLSSNGLLSFGRPPPTSSFSQRHSVPAQQKHKTRVSGSADCNVTDVESGEVCAGHGKCFFGACSCDGDYSGESCEYYFPEWLDDSFCCDGDALSNSNVAPYNTLAFLWTDLNPWAGGEIFYGYISDLDSFAVVFKDIPSYSSLSCRTTIEVLLRSDGLIELIFVNNDIGYRSECTLNTVSVGAKGPSGSGFDFLQVMGPSTSSIRHTGHFVIGPSAAPSLTPTFTATSPSLQPEASPNSDYSVVMTSFDSSLFYDDFIDAQYLSLPDDGWASLSLPFPFPYFGREFVEVKVVSNGLVGFEGAYNRDNMSYSYVGQDLGRSDVYNDILAFLWTDLDPSSGGDVVVGKVDSDTVALQFSDVPAFGLIGCRTTVEVVLHRSGVIEMIYVSNDIGAVYGCTGSDNIRNVSIGLKGRGSSAPYIQLYGPSSSGILQSGHITAYPASISPSQAPVYSSWTPTAYPSSYETFSIVFEASFELMLSASEIETNEAVKYSIRYAFAQIVSSGDNVDAVSIDKIESTGAKLPVHSLLKNSAQVTCSMILIFDDGTSSDTAVLIFSNMSQSLISAAADGKFGNIATAKLFELVPGVEIEIELSEAPPVISDVKFVTPGSHAPSITPDESSGSGGGMSTVIVSVAAIGGLCGGGMVMWCILMVRTASRHRSKVSPHGTGTSGQQVQQAPPSHDYSRYNSPEAAQQTGNIPSVSVDPSSPYWANAAPRAKQDEGYVQNTCAVVSHFQPPMPVVQTVPVYNQLAPLVLPLQAQQPVATVPTVDIRNFRPVDNFNNS